MPVKKSSYFRQCTRLHRREAGLAKGFTLIELIVFIIIIGIATVGLFSALNQHNLSSVDPIYQVRALELAQAQLDEIIGKRYDQNSPNGGFPPCNSGEAGALPCVAFAAGDKAALDDVDDYDGFNAVPAIYGGYTMNVQVTVVTLTGQPAKLVAVRVTPPVGEPVELSAYRANF